MTRGLRIESFSSETEVLESDRAENSSSSALTAIFRRFRGPRPIPLPPALLPVDEIDSGEIPSPSASCSPCPAPAFRDAMIVDRLYNAEIGIFFSTCRLGDIKLVGTAARDGATAELQTRTTPWKALTQGSFMMKSEKRSAAANAFLTNE